MEVIYGLLPGMLLLGLVGVAVFFGLFAVVSMTIWMVPLTGY